MAKYNDAVRGRWIQPIRKGYKFCCCDCGLVHRLDFRVRKRKVELRSFRDNRATGQVRRHMKGGSYFVLDIPSEQQTCGKCGHAQYFEFGIKDEIWAMLPDRWRSTALCIDCFIQEMDNVLEKTHELTLEDFDFVALVGNKLKLTILDRNPKKGMKPEITI